MSANSIDLDTLNELKEIMEDDFDELLSTFIDDSQTQLENLKLAIDSSTLEDIRRIAHTLKGSSSNIGANLLSEICHSLETDARNNSTENAHNLLNELVTEYEEVKKILDENF